MAPFSQSRHQSGGISACDIIAQFARGGFVGSQRIANRGDPVCFSRERTSCRQTHGAHIGQPSCSYTEDVSVLHPHGFASRRPDVFPSSKTITFTALDFDRQTGQQSNFWRTKLLIAREFHAARHRVVGGRASVFATAVEPSRTSSVEEPSTRPTTARPILRGGAGEYFETTPKSLFKMDRPR